MCVYDFVQPKDFHDIGRGGGLHNLTLTVFNNRAGPFWNFKSLHIAKG